MVPETADVEKEEVVTEDLETPTEEVTPNEETGTGGKLSELNEAWKALQEQSDGDTQEPKAETESGSDGESLPEIDNEKPKEAPKQTKTGAKTQAPNQGEESYKEVDTDLLPPARFKPHEKQWFNKIQNKALKSAIVKSFKDMEGLMTRTTQEASTTKNEAASIAAVAQEFRDQWAEYGLRPDEFLRRLANAQKKLTDPKTRDETFINLGLDTEISETAWKQLGAKRGFIEGSEVAQGGATSDISTHPTVKALEDKINQLQERYEPLYTEKRAASENEVAKIKEAVENEVSTVLHEVDAAGNYKRPELFNDNAFFDRWKAQTIALKGTAFGSSWSDASKNAYRIMKGQPPMASGQPTESRIPAANNRAVSAAISVRGKSTPSPSTTAIRAGNTNGHSAVAQMNSVFNDLIAGKL